MTEEEPSEKSSTIDALRRVLAAQQAMLMALKAIIDEQEAGDEQNGDSVRQRRD